ncbi:hypothetical protein M0534_13295 [Methylonatrum kenyense]|uniref:hypothetical protein n=1 Tax=Methylonatrum kenyense TaxID=455253 RepID=UPI0020BD6DD2|nr:hypothetical protein [Methylonatrum kenyense]MCK8517290.1 hypothetical protein [Methylonatrum kenyense]
MNEQELQQALGLSEPWRILRAETDAASRRVDVWVSDQPPAPGLLERLGFGSRRPRLVRGDGERVWRHCNIGTFRCFIHTSHSPSSTLSFLGSAGAPFTNAMAMQISELLGSGASYRAVCAVLDLDFKDVWQLKRLGEREGLSVGRQSGADGAEAEVAPTTAVPDLADPVWDRLVSGELNHAVKALNLRLLLSRVQSQLRGVEDREMREIKYRELRRFFVNNERGLKHELDRLISAAR